MKYFPTHHIFAVAKDDILESFLILQAVHLEGWKELKS